MVSVTKPASTEAADTSPAFAIITPDGSVVKVRKLVVGLAAVELPFAVRVAIPAVVTHCLNCVVVVEGECSCFSQSQTPYVEGLLA